MKWLPFTLTALRYLLINLGNLVIGWTCGLDAHLNWADVTWQQQLILAGNVAVGIGTTVGALQNGSFQKARGQELEARSEERGARTPTPPNSEPGTRNPELPQ